MSRKSPTSRTLDYVRSEGKVGAVAEKWVPLGSGPKCEKCGKPEGGRRIDLFGFVDVVVLDPIEGAVTFVQATTWRNVPARVRKLSTYQRREGRKIVVEGARDAVEAALASGVDVEVWGWRKAKGKPTRYELRRVRLFLPYVDEPDGELRQEEILEDPNGPSVATGDLFAQTGL